MGISSISGGMSTYGSKGMGGLMSGLDVDELVKGMTSGTSGKIAKLMQKKQSSTWKADAYRAISSPLYDFAQKYINSTSKSNLSGNGIFSKSAVTASGLNSKYLSVTGKSNSAELMQILAVEKLAENASKSLSGGAVGDITSGAIDLNAEVSMDTLKGQSITVSYEGKDYNITLKDKVTVVDDPDAVPPTTHEEALTYDTWDEAVQSINTLIEKDPALKDIKGKVSFAKNGNSLAISNTGDKELKIKSATNDMLKMLGLDHDDDKDAAIAAGATHSFKGTLGMTNKEALAGKSISFTYNGVTKSIQLGTESEIDTVDKLAKNMQGKLDAAFGSGRIKVESNVGKLNFKTTLPNGTSDPSSVLKISSADEGLLGEKGALQMINGASNRVNINTTADKSGLKGMGDLKAVELTDKDGKTYQGYVINVNGKEVTLKAEDSVAAIISTINKANAGVNITYNEISDTFNIKATDSGAGGKIEITDVSGKGNLAAKLFNFDATGNVYTSGLDKNGADAEIIVDFDGVGQGADPTKITRSSNNFNLDGLNVTVNQVFDSFKKDQNGGYIDNAGNSVSGADRVIDKDSLVRFTAAADTDKIVDTVKQMAEDYNNLVDAIEKASTQKHDKKYPPLTAEQKKEMSEDEIKTWEAKAKEGLLFNDSTLNMLAGDLRFIFSNYTEDGLKSIGISNSGTGTNSYKNNGKITVDEDSLRKALAERPDDVTKLFTEAATTKMVDGVAVKDPLSGGVMTKMKAVTDRYTATVGIKGIFIEKVGHPASPVSMMSNSMQKANDEIDKTISRLKDTLSAEEARYYKQFTQLEMLVNQMNSQSSALSGLTGGA